MAYRLALDHPYRVDRLAVLDIAPTGDAWAGFTADEAMAKFHWTFLAQTEPLPETMIAANPVLWLETLMAFWSGSGDLAGFDPVALAQYHAAFDAERIHASCEDYRAGATIDREIDEADRHEGRKINRPMLVLWGSEGGISAKGDVLGLWRGWCTDVEGQALPCGHFLPEEAPDATASALAAFLSERPCV